MIYGDNRPHNVALIVPDGDAIRSWAATAGRGALNPAAQLQDQALLDQIAADIAKVSVSFRGYERIAAFTLLPEPFTQENGMLTPSMKLKRRKIIERWRQHIDLLYRSDEPSSPGRGWPPRDPSTPSASCGWISRSAPQARCQPRSPFSTTGA